MFENRARPLYGQAELIRLGRLESLPAVRYVEREFERTGKSAGDTAPYLVDAIAKRWIALRAQARLQIYVLPHGRDFVVCDGPSLAFIRTRHATLQEAEAEADSLARTMPPADIMVFDSTDPNDVPAWAVEAPGGE